jgi:hypothetical protein
LQLHKVAGLESSIRGFADLATGAKTIQFQLARAMTRKKALDLSALDNMAQTWQGAVADLQASLNRSQQREQRQRNGSHDQASAVRDQESGIRNESVS